LLHELPVHERESLPCRTQHWQLPALTGFELIASEWSADSADWRYIPTGKVVFAFIEEYQPYYRIDCAALALGLARAGIGQHHVDYIRPYHTPRRTLELLIDEARFREELSRHLDSPVGKLSFSRSTATDSAYSRSLFAMMQTLRDMFAANAHGLALKHQGAAILATLIQGPLHNHAHRCHRGPARAQRRWSAPARPPSTRSPVPGRGPPAGRKAPGCNPCRCANSNPPEGARLQRPSAHQFANRPKGARLNPPAVHQFANRPERRPAPPPHSAGLRSQEPYIGLGIRK
jgi:hypothetical protein